MLKNFGSTAVSLAPNPSTDGITVSQGSTVVWYSPRIVASRGAALSIQPGRGLKLTSTWNGRPNEGGLRHLPPGVYTVQATAGGYTGTTQIDIV